jgi:hypothetical protein
MFHDFVMYVINGINWDDAVATDYNDVQTEQLEAWGRAFN